MTTTFKKQILKVGLLHNGSQVANRNPTKLEKLPVLSHLTLKIQEEIFSNKIKIHNNLSSTAGQLQAISLAANLNFTKPGNLSFLSHSAWKTNSQSH